MSKPPPRSPHRSFTWHADVARHLRANPGVWGHVSTHRTSAGAYAQARRVNTASTRTPAYQPAGAFRARIVPAGDDWAVEARYMGRPLGRTRR